MSNQESVARAVNNILQRTFNLRRDQNLLIFADTASLEVVDAFTRGGRELGISVTAFFVPRVLQTDNRPARGLSLPAEAAIREADAILTCLSDQPDLLGYGMQVLNTSWSRRAKVAHAPNLTLEGLRVADVDYNPLAEQARLLALTLILGKRIEIATSDSRKQEHRLSMRISGWSNPPGINDGVLRDGSWGDLLPGQVYIVPRSGEGRIVVNGALPGRVLSANEELLLTFRDGRLAGVEPEESPAARHLRDTQFAYAERRGDPNWANLAEIGFGLNPAVQDLTGVSAVDNKKSHTVHIGLGQSTSVGGDVESLIHCDLVIRRPSVFVNGRLIMKRGDWRINEPDWRLDHRTVAVPAGWWDQLTLFGRSGVRTERDGSRLMCAWNAGRGRWDSAPVGVEQTARLAARLYDLLPETGGLMPRDRFLADAAGAGIPETAIPGLCWVLQQFDLVRLVASSEGTAGVPRPTTSGNPVLRRHVGPV